jgi:hypothetical protein
MGNTLKRRRGRPRVLDPNCVRKTVRLPRSLVRELVVEAKQKGYRCFSDYVRNLLEGT